MKMDPASINRKKRKNFDIRKAFERVDTVMTEVKEDGSKGLSPSE